MHSLGKAAPGGFKMSHFRYEKVKTALADLVVADHKPGDRLPTLKELARHFDVSRNTIQKAVDELAAEHVLCKRRGSGIFVSDPKARSLRIGFIYPWTMQQLHTYQWHLDLMRQVEEEVTRHGHELIVSCNVGREADSQAPESLLRALLSLDGVLFFNMYNNRVVRDVIERNVPVVLVHQVSPIYNVDRVEADGAGGTALAAEHLMEMGHRRIGFLTDRSKFRGNHHLLFEAREEGWRETMRSAGLPVDDSLVLHAPPADWDDACMQSFRKMVSGHNPVTAFICINDIAASYLYRAAHNVGLRVPQDLSVVGCENTSLSDLLNPRITSVDIPQSEIGSFAVSKLLRIIHTGRSEHVTTLFRTCLVIKESTAAPRRLAEDDLRVAVASI